MKYEIEGTIIKTEDGRYNILGNDNTPIMSYGYGSLKSLLMDLARNLNEQKDTKKPSLNSINERLDILLKEAELTDEGDDKMNLGDFYLANSFEDLES